MSKNNTTTKSSSAKNTQKKPRAPRNATRTVTAANKVTAGDGQKAPPALKDLLCEQLLRFCYQEDYEVLSNESSTAVFPTPPYVDLAYLKGDTTKWPSGVTPIHRYVMQAAPKPWFKDLMDAYVSELGALDEDSCATMEDIASVIKCSALLSNEMTITEDITLTYDDDNIIPDLRALLDNGIAVNKHISSDLRKDLVVAFLLFMKKIAHVHVLFSFRKKTSFTKDLIFGYFKIMMVDDSIIEQIDLLHSKNVDASPGEDDTITGDINDPSANPH